MVHGLFFPSLYIWLPGKPTAGVVELVDALRSGRSARKGVPVRVRPSALLQRTRSAGREQVGLWCLGAPASLNMIGSVRCGHCLWDVRDDHGRIADGRTSSGSDASPNTARRVSFAWARVDWTNCAAPASASSDGWATPAPSNKTLPNRTVGASR